MEVKFKRITKSMEIQDKNLEKLLSNYHLYPVDGYNLLTNDNKSVEVDGNNLPERMILSGEFILKLKEQNNG